MREKSTRSRGASRRFESESALRDRILIALTDKAVMLKVADATHGAASWTASAISSSQRELQEGLDLIDAERARLDANLRNERERRARLSPGIELAACESECERLLCRLQELVDHREQLTGLQTRVRAEVEVESIEWQRALALADGSVAGFVDIWATLRVTSYRVTQGADPGDHEQRPRYEGYSVHHLIRSLALFVEPTVESLTGLVRQVRYAQAYAKNALPVLVTCRPVATDLLASQGIPTYVWSPIATPIASLPAAPSTSRRVKRVSAIRRPPAPAPAQAQLPSPRASLPPASLH